VSDEYKRINVSVGSASRKLRGELEEVALLFFRAGFNVVPVGPDKRPVSRTWSAERRLPARELLEGLEKATGIALVGGGEHPLAGAAVLVLIDVDKPSLLDRSPALRKLAERTLCWRTGPRCPRCESKHLEALEPGARFKCRECGAEFTAGEAGRGLGIAVLVDAQAAEKYGLTGTRRRWGEVELLVSNYQLIPPSLHPSGLRYEWVRPPQPGDVTLGIAALVERDLAELAGELGLARGAEGEAGGEGEAGAGLKLRELGNAEVLKLVELLRPAYKPGQRQFIWLYLSGWCAKARVSYLSAARVLKALYEESGDEDSLRSRGSCIVYSYEKAGIRVDKRALAQVLGVEPYGPEALEREEVRGKAGLQEILERELGEEGAVDAIREIEEVLGAASPFRDSVLALLNYEKQLYAVANLSKLVVVRAALTASGGRRLRYKERVFIGAPTEVVVYLNPLGGVTKYQVRWEVATRRRPLVIGPCTVEEVLARLRAEGLVVCSRLASDVLAALLDAYIRKGRAEVREEIDKPGFYWVDGRLVAVRVDLEGGSGGHDAVRLPRPSKEEIREALSLLVELGERWYGHAQEVFAEVVRWGVLAPFIFAYKQRGRWVPWPYAFGASNAGKTTLFRVVLAMWGLGEGARWEKSGASVNNVARMGEVLSSGTFPMLVNEVAAVLRDPALAEMVKAAVETTVARGKFMVGVYTEIPALAPLMLTSNAARAPEDEGLARRLYLYPFTHSMVLPQERVREFEEKVKPRLGRLRALGAFAAHYVMERGLPEKPEDLPRLVLEEAFRAVGLEAPDWLWKVPERVTPEDIREELVERIRVCLAEAVNEAFARSVGRIVALREDGGAVEVGRGEASFEDRLHAVLTNRLLPWVILRGDRVYITSGVLGELEKRGIVGVSTLRDLAEVLGWEYIPKRSIREGRRVRNLSVVSIEYEALKKFLLVAEEQPSQE
jgi:hypothetical protein